METILINGFLTIVGAYFAYYLVMKGVAALKLFKVDLDNYYTTNENTNYLVVFIGEIVFFFDHIIHMINDFAHSLVSKR